MLKLKEIAEYLNGTIINGNPKAEFRYFSNAEKKDRFEEHFLFPKYQKNKRLQEDEYKAIISFVKKHGGGYVIEEELENKQELIDATKKINPNINIVEARKARKALEKLGKQSRIRNYDKPVIAVTGSYGKTTLCNLIAKILLTKYKVLYDENVANLNTSKSISRKLLNLNEYDLAVLEIGVAAPNIMKYLTELAQPSVAVITSIGTAHIEEFKTLDSILEEKMHIVDGLRDVKLLFVNKDDTTLKKVRESEDYQLCGYSIREADDIKYTKQGISFTTKIYGEEVRINTKIYQKFFVRNVILAIKIAEMLEIDKEQMIKVIENYTNINRRFETSYYKEKDITIINDTFNSCFETAKEGIETAAKIKAKRRIAIIGTIGNTAGGPEETRKMHAQLGEVFKNKKYDYLFLIGSYAKKIKETAVKYMPEERVIFLKSQTKLVGRLENIIQDGDLFYFKDGGTLITDLNIAVKELKTNHNWK